MKLLKTFVILIFASIFPVSALSDELNLSSKTDPAAAEHPYQGMSQVDVQKKFGDPKDWRDAIGDPPISRWIYDDFTVYFEFDKVIHSVVTPD